MKNQYCLFTEKGESAEKVITAEQFYTKDSHNHRLDRTTLQERIESVILGTRATTNSRHIQQILISCQHVGKFDQLNVCKLPKIPPRESGPGS